MSKKIFMLTITPKNRPLEEIDIYSALDKALDWLKISPSCWLIFTSSDSEVWFDRIRKVTEKWGDNFLIMELNPHNKQGWLKSSVWDWINDHKSKIG